MNPSKMKTLLKLLRLYLKLKLRGLFISVLTLKCHFTLLGYAVIFSAIKFFGFPEFLSWPMFAQIVMVVIGVKLIVKAERLQS